MPDKKETVTLLSNQKNPINIPYLDANGVTHNVLILPDYNFNFSKEKLDLIRSHPAFSFFEQKGKLKVHEDNIIGVKIEGEELGIKTVDTVEKEAAVMVDSAVVNSSTSPKFTPTRDRLMAYHGMTRHKASAILNAMPDGGWENKSQFLADPVVKRYDIDWTSENLKPSNL